MIILKETSPATKNYNCIAWAVEDDTKRWEPDPFGSYYWPESVPRRYSVDTFIAAYQTMGYIVCNGENVEFGFKKIAIYADSIDRPQHAARQLNNGKWTSKLGDFEDVEHSFIRVWEKCIMQTKPINLSNYGQLATLMKKPC